MIFASMMYSDDESKVNVPTIPRVDALVRIEGIEGRLGFRLVVRRVDGSGMSTC